MTLTMNTKIVTTKDRGGIFDGKPMRLQIPHNMVPVTASQGFYGWRCELAAPGGIRVHFHNGKPMYVFQMGECLWEWNHKYNRRRKQARRESFVAQKAFFQYAFGKEVAFA